ncbi:hypothetical protein AMELA_G00243220 [Ameiurus melas]|uniref:Uncharacterized protein n=1 Tax=Ameiurus melas TaxID=219545 RepID=A0A7J5ZYM8_AMEME|nr:hypothetical protein AMELA_G00243220 [Ameiurus melas]
MCTPCRSSDCGFSSQTRVFDSAERVSVKSRLREEGGIVSRSVQRIAPAGSVQLQHICSVLEPESFRSSRTEEEMMMMMMMMMVVDHLRGPRKGTKRCFLSVEMISSASSITLLTPNDLESGLGV